MSTTKPALPTLSNLKASICAADYTNATDIATEWFRAFTSKVEAGDADGVSSLFIEDSFWRDILSLTWDIRTFHGASVIKKFLQDRLANTGLKAFELEGTPELQQPYPDIAWIQGLFKFETSVGAGDGVFRIVPTSSGEWKAHVVYTNLQSLTGHPEKIGVLRNQKANHGKWFEERQRELNFEDVEPYVVIIGGGQSGLDVAARLKFLDVPTLVLEKSARVGDQWRGRYEALSLHDPVWYDHMPYIPFPDFWPVWTPAHKLADWLESYSNSLELNVWTSSPALSVRQDAETKEWTVVVKRGSTGQERTFHPTHVVFALGMASGAINVPELPGQDNFEGKVLHTTQYKTARDYVGKKVVVVGAGNSAHDTSADLASHDVDVTMYQRSPTYIMSAKERVTRMLIGYNEGGPPTAISDRIGGSFPFSFFVEMHKRAVPDIAEADKELLDGLRKRGFKLTMGEEGAGFLLLAINRGGGYYLDMGASQMIVDGKIKLKSDSELETFTKTGLKFKDGSVLEADVVLLATGFGDLMGPIREICGDEIADKLKIWGLDTEGEIRGTWRYAGVENLWYMMGGLALCRYHSTHLALQIKAIKEGLWTGRYSG